MATVCNKVGNVILDMAGVSNILNEVYYLLSPPFS